MGSGRVRDGPERRWQYVGQRVAERQRVRVDDAAAVVARCTVVRRAGPERRTATTDLRQPHAVDAGGAERAGARWDRRL